MSTNTSVKKKVQGPLIGSSLGFGAGMALGFLLIYLLLISPIVSRLVDLVVETQPLVKIILGLSIFLVTIGRGGGRRLGRSGDQSL